MAKKELGSTQKKQKLYEVNAKNIEYLQTQYILATSKADAISKWKDRWDNGNILVVDSETKLKTKEISKDAK